MIDIYQKYLSGLRKHSEIEWKVNCPFHKEDTPSFFINGKTGQYYCFGCGASGNVYTFLDLVNHPEDKSTIKLSPCTEEEIIGFAEPISLKLIEQLHRNLLNDYSKLQYIIRDRCISYFVIKKFLIGYDTSSERFAIPIKSRTGKFVNIKLHNSNKVPKSLYFQSGKARLFPFSALLKSQIILCEGEFDCLALHSLGLNAMTSTSGSLGWKEEWSQFFHKKEVIIIYDNDESGRKGIDLVNNSIGSYCANIRSYSHLLDINTDVTDFLRKKGDIYKLLGLRKRK